VHPQVNSVPKLSITCRLWLLLRANLEPMVVILFAQQSHRVCSLRVISEHPRGPLPYFPICPWNFESRDEILLKGGRLWRPRVLITVINANDRISRVKPVKHRSNLGQTGSSPQKPHQWTLINPLTKSTHTRGGPLVKDMVKTGLTVDVSECRPELLPRSPKFT
jgi:hypothetical protein